MVTFFIIVVFVLGYLAIAFEHSIRVNKAASALITGVLCWTLYVLHSDSSHHVSEQLLGHLGDIASIIFFLLGAMTIVELIDSHHGFDLISRHIQTSSKPKLLLIIVVITFFLSAFLDNLTTTIVMTSLCSRMLYKKEDKLWFAGMIVIAANAGGAWSPLGDVTTTMLWIGGQITARHIMHHLIIPSLAVCVLPAFLIAYRFRGQTVSAKMESTATVKEKRDGRLVLIAGMGFLLFVPVFKTITDLPPFMGMLLVLGLMWIVTTVIHKRSEVEYSRRFTVAHALQRIDTPSILFFLGILLAVSALESYGLLKELAAWLKTALPNDFAIGSVFGLLSALIDNVPLVAATQGMYDLSLYPVNHPFWEFIALTTGTGGSIIITGSAAGVAAMGVEQIDFIWFLKKISWLALIGFLTGILVYPLQHGIGLIHIPQMEQLLSLFIFW